MCPSTVAWLDHSTEQQQRVREMLALFAESDTVDDLGIGTIRDAFANKFFPGSSVIQTRARYFLFIPWTYKHFEQKASSRLLDKGRDAERQLIEQLRAGSDGNGLIGKQAGANLRTLPSAI